MLEIASKSLAWTHSQLACHAELSLHAHHMTNALQAAQPSSLHACPACRREEAQEGKRARMLFPRLDPAVIMLVSCGDWLLLGRNARWAPGRFSLLAGEPCACATWWS